MPKAAAVRRKPKALPRRRAATSPRGERAIADPASVTRSGGLLIVLIGEEGRGKEMLLAIARRRFGADAGMAFPPRISTRAQAADVGDELVTRRTFREMEGAGAFLCCWDSGGHAYGLGKDALAALENGITVVVVAGREAAARFSAVWPDVRVVEVRAGPDTILSGRRGGVPNVLSVNHQGDLASAVRSFHELISSMRLERLTEGAPSHPLRGKALDRLMAPRPARRAPLKACLRSQPHRA